MTLTPLRGWPLERQVPVFISGLLAVVLGGFTAAAYREVRQAAFAAATERLHRVTQQLGDILETGAKTRIAEITRAAADPSLAAYLRAPTPAARRAAAAALTRLAGETNAPLLAGVELWDTAGRRWLRAGRTLPDLDAPSIRALVALLPSADTAAVGPLRSIGDSLVYSVIGSVANEDRVLGYVVMHRRVSTSQQATQQLTGLIGFEVSLLLGNASGDVWTNLAARAEAPPLVAPLRPGLHQYVRPDRGAYFAQAAPVAGTPWWLVIEFPQAAFLARATAFLSRAMIIALALVIAGAGAAWTLSRRIIRTSEARLRSVTDTAHEAIVVADTAGTIVFWNPGAARMFGYTGEEVMGRPLTMLMPERFRGAHTAGLERYGATGEGRVVGRTVELEGRRKNGQEFPLELSLAQARHGGRASFIGIIRDVTERKRAEAELRTLNQELESFSYSVSHDLRAPLRAIDGFSRILLEDHGPGFGPEGQRLLGVVRANTQRMGQLIDDLLAFSRLGRKELTRARVDMTALAQATVEELQQANGDRPVEITIDPLPPALGDRGLLRQVWSNLLGNAFKFTRGRPTPRIGVSARPNGDETVYLVTDNGVGFDPSYADKLFGVFQRLHHAEEFEGTGVGLAIVQRVVHRHGGRVWADAVVDRGATFYFTIPTERPEA
jgi:PAS domain S-box-containing protein